jgi:hypothetical protein
MLAVAYVRAQPLLFWFLLCCPVERGDAGNRKKKEEKDPTKVAMPHHSFQIPLAYEEVLNDWMASGASLVERERLLMHPSVSERAGFFFNKDPLLTNDFEATVHFRVVGPKDPRMVAVDQSFGFWYVQENISAGYNEPYLIKAPSWKSGLAEIGFGFNGFKSTFKGFGAVLSMADASRKPRPVVSGVWNDGKRELRYGRDVPTMMGAKAIDFRNTLNAAQLRIRVTPTSVVAHLKQSPSLSWNECFKMDRKGNPALNIKAGGYLGFSAWTGAASENTVPDMISITQFEVYNFDTTSIGEEMKDVSREIQEAYRDMLTDDNRHFHDQKSQKEHLERLISMLQQHAETTHPADLKMYQDLEGIQGRMSMLDEGCKTLVKELRVLVGGEGVEKDGDLKDEIIGIRRLLVKDSASHRQKLDIVQKNLAEVKEQHSLASKPEVFTAVAQQSEHMESTVVTASYQMTWMLLAIVASIAAIGVLMWNRMRYYEKKHFI